MTKANTPSTTPAAPAHQPEQGNNSEPKEKVHSFDYKSLDAGTDTRDSLARLFKLNRKDVDPTEFTPPSSKNRHVVAKRKDQSHADTGHGGEEHHG